MFDSIYPIVVRNLKVAMIPRKHVVVDEKKYESPTILQKSRNKIISTRIYFGIKHYD